MIILRSLLFNILFYIHLMIWMICGLPTFLMPRRYLTRYSMAWARSSVALTRIVAGIRTEFRGLENIPDEGVIVVAKHQSFLETFAIAAAVHDGTLIYKRELAWIPFFGWYLWGSDFIAINRGSRAAAVAKMNRDAAKELAQGRQLVIFAEGTRRAPGAPPAYKQGFSHLYMSLNRPILPVGINTGLFWPRRRFIRRPGTAIIEFLPVIPAGLPRDEAFARTRDAIEACTNRLVAEGLAELGPDAPALGDTPGER